jgi:hypothetical protein
MPVTLLGFTLQGFSLSKSRIPLGTSSSLAVRRSFENLRTTPAFPRIRLPRAELPRLLRAPRQSWIGRFRLPPELVPEVAQRFPRTASRRTRTALRIKLNRIDDALSNSSLTCRSRPWRDPRQITPTSEFCSLRESVPTGASSPAPDGRCPPGFFSPL